MDNKDKEYLINRVNDYIDELEYKEYVISNIFYSYTESSIIINYLKSINFYNYIFYGGNYNNDDKRVLILFSNDIKNIDSIDNLWILNNIDEVYKDISILKILFKNNNKYIDNYSLTHRDYLGALINLGIKREYIGDIYIIKDNNYIKEAIIFIKSSIKEIIINDLKRVKRSEVIIKELDLIKDYDSYINLISFNYIDLKIKVISLRLDLIISKTFNLSREEVKEIINKERVFINGETITNPSYSFINKENIRISIKGIGKFIYVNKEDYLTKKNKYIVNIKKFS